MERPADAPSADTPCEVCGRELGDWWGVTVIKHLNTSVGKMLTYQPVHSACWWETHPDAVDRDNERLKEVRNSYTLKREETRKQKEAAAKKRAEMESKIS